MPDPFRHYEGVPVLDLPADPPSPQIPALDLLQGVAGASSAHTGPGFVSQLLFYAAAISATKRVPAAGYSYALRVNPSSGNLHPTEFHFATRGLTEFGLDGLYHYRPSSHMAEQRGLGDFSSEARRRLNSSSRASPGAKPGSIANVRIDIASTTSVMRGRHWRCRLGRLGGIALRWAILRTMSWRRHAG